ncbi:VPLPA-CTERM sorting domain-containing protein [Cypionkella sp. TWP1-2-1b2]|uniref:VPLPA-CTERM sorting domain-containing protein n=1 Tax=Cypionkella sp. TWP1-2-1b2 TaxID=2804675 RepID=UPI003CF81ADD
MIVRTKILGALAVLLTTAGMANATTYTVNQSFGGGGVSGTIETDGAIGVIGTSNILNWSLTLTDTLGSFFLNGFSNSEVHIEGSAFFATVTDLLFDFDAGSGFVAFQNPDFGSSQNFWCIDNGDCADFTVPGQTVSVGFAEWNVSGAHFSGVVSIGTTVAAVPLPASLPLLLAGLGVLGISRKRRKSNFA